MIKRFLVSAMLLCMIILQQGVDYVYAQEPDEEENPIIIAPSGRLDLTLEQLNYGNDTLDRDRPALSYRIDLPGNFQILPTGNYFDLTTSHLFKTPDRSASLEVGLNGQPVAALTLTEDNESSSTTRVDLPEDTLQVGRNSIEFYLDTGETCDDPGAFVDVLIEESSTLSFEYQQNPYPVDLSLYPFPFVENNLLQIPVTIVLPDHPTSDDLTAAAIIAAGLGRMSNGRIDLTATLASDLDAEILDNNHLIVMGQSDDNDLFSDLELLVPINNSVLEPGQGILQEIVSPWNEFRLLLVVSGLDSEGVLNASHALNRQAHFLGMRGPLAVVIDLLPLPKSEASREASITLASLGYEDEVVYGAAPQAYTFWFELLPGWRLEEPPFFALKFAHADTLDPYESVIDVNLNNLPVGSTLLDESNVNQGELIVSLPKNLLRAGLNRLDVEVEMSLLNGDKCIDKDNERAWTVISSESEIFLPYQDLYLSPLLRHFPYPFSRDSGFDQALFVLPDQSSSSVINNVIQLAVQMGRPSEPEYISPRVAYASEVDTELRENYHLILLGPPTENALLSEVNTYLPQPFEANSNTLQPLVVDDVAFVPDPTRDAGLLEIMRSPWNEDYYLLAITGTTKEGVELTFEPLLEAPWRFNGNLAVIESVDDPLPDEDPISVYSTYVQSLTPTQSEANEGGNSTASDDNLPLLAKRWWK